MGFAPVPYIRPGALTMTHPLSIGPHQVQPPVVLAPMAGITNAPFRTLCREFSGGKGLFVSEMITTRALVERNEKRSEEHTSELQSQFHLVCRLLLEKKKRIT